MDYLSDVPRAGFNSDLQSRNEHLLKLGLKPGPYTKTGTTIVGAIYDKPVVQALRFHSAAYLHGHQVGGTNPSLVEALGAGNPVVAHDNRFNRWVAGDGAVYFSCADTFSMRMDELLSGTERLDILQQYGQIRFNGSFAWSDVLNQYEELFEEFLPV